MFTRLGNFVSRHWLLVILLWIAALVGVRTFAPRWNDVTHDGDFAYLPESKPRALGEKGMKLIEAVVRQVRPSALFEFEREAMPSVVGERLLDEAFPDNRAKSQIVLLVARHEGRLRQEDLEVANRLALRFHNYHGAASLERAKRLKRQVQELQQRGEDQQAQDTQRRADKALSDAKRALDEAILLDEHFAAAFHNRALWHTYLGHPEQAEQDRQEALRLDRSLRHRAGQVAPAGADDLPILNVWTRHTEVVKRKLRSTDGKAQLILIQLANEFMATDNIRVMQKVRSELDMVRRQVERDGPAGLVIGLSGSAAVGGDILLSAAESIKNTELTTITLVIIILLLVYRSPLLMVVPLVTILVSLSVATGLVAALTQLSGFTGWEWWNFKVFTTTKIFIVVILFGAGTDYCLFLISRYREELDAGLQPAEAISAALCGVGDALAASALTTILGLSMMFFADFGKFSNSGPAIGICLLVSLVACITLAPALLRALGGAVFWPFGTATAGAGRAAGSTGPALLGTLSNRFWWKVSRVIVTRPGLILILCIAFMLPLAVKGTSVEVTYDLQSGLDRSRPSRQGTELLKQHFPVGESGPVIVLARKEDGQLNSRTGAAAIRRLTQSLYLDGVIAVRSIADPLGERLDPRSPKKRRRYSLARARDWRSLAMRKHRVTEGIFLTPVPRLQGDVARFELVLAHDPFSLEAAEVLARIDRRLHTEQDDPQSFWHGAQFVYSGTTAAIRDLRWVTRADNRRIQLLVVLAVLAVLIAILRRPLLCVYLIASVLLSYYVTIGATELFFGYIYGADYPGLDWKLPLFLFVILVALGEDYNIYLVTRVLQEQQRYGPFGGLRRAVVRTGGIITSCGVIMAGTFISMTSGSLRGIVELGFALSLGVLIDTLIVRPILVPAFLALMCHWQAAAWRPLRSVAQIKTAEENRAAEPAG